MAAADAKPVPIKDAVLRITFPILDADGDLVSGATTPDSEFSEDGATFADCASEATEIATSSGMYFLDVAAAEMGGETVAIIVKTATAGAKTTPIVMYPQSAANPINVNTQAITAGAITATAIAADAIGASELAADAVAEIADAIWDEDATAHQTQGTFGQAIGDPAADANTIYKATVSDATGATVGVDVVAVQADTDNIQTRLPAALVGGRMDSDVAAIQSGAITATAIAADAIGASELAADAVAEIADAIWDEAMTESGGVPAVSASFRDALRWMFALSRNKITQTATTQALRNDADGANLATAAVSDDGVTATRAEWV